MDTEMEWYKAWFIFYIAIGGWTCLFLSLKPKGDNSVKALLIGLIVLLLTPAVDAYTQLVFDAPIPILQSIRFNLTWVYGPLMLLLVQRVLILKGSEKQTNWLVLGHFVPFVIVATMQLNQIMIPISVFVTGFFLQVFSYLALSFYQLLSCKAKLKRLALEFSDTSYFWLLFLIAGLAVAMAVDLVVVVMMIKQWQVDLNLLNLYACGLGLFVCLIAVLTVIDTPILFTHSDESVTSNTLSPNTPQVLRELELSPSMVIALSDTLQHVIQTQEPHLDSDISLAKLADLLGISSHQLSELLNVHLDTNFYDFLNQHRLIAAITLLERADVRLSISEIVYQSGFNNRSTFYKVFKAKFSQTPSDYRRALIAKNAFKAHP
ncbi:helix-turn-helix domain-containing protein [Pseudoalteromonas ulvae]|uniref:HTH araC/xylS-type domain-containing protein n=1 Tax=Pseudoalteromonas ulvae TaxID=107327 RepID=A0A244CLG0_PSEDV|nr:AraC family transcriptional regulator [Pseudoalteromonas ulvae]OUL56457.1 hypothetical protein B1199_17490 [Pseudoalteromonas ulvae]